MSRRRDSRALLPVLVTLLICPGIAAALPDSDSKTGMIINKTDQPLDFRARLSLTEVDDDTLPAAHVGIDTTWYAVTGTHWNFELCWRIKDWKFAAGPPPAVPPAKPNGAHNLELYLRGHHITAPHPNERPRNVLPLQHGIRVNLGFNATADVNCRTFHVQHPGQPKPHYDIYGATSHPTAVDGPAYGITGPIEIVAAHRDRSESALSFTLTCGGSGGGGAKASYDAVARRLTIHLGQIDILNSTGLLLPAIENAYLQDPMRFVATPDIVMDYLGPSPDGGFLFGPGHVSLSDPTGSLLLAGDFSQYIIHDTSHTGPLDSFAVFDTTTALDTGNCGSTFLEQFADTDMMWNQLSSQDLAMLQGVMFTFVTQENLAAMTSGFNVSAYDVPATVVVTGSRESILSSGVAEPRPDSSLPPVWSAPNPFSGATSINFELPAAGPVDVSIFDVAGRRIRRLVTGAEQGAGPHHIDWDGKLDDGSVARAGIYFYRVGTRYGVQRSRLVRVR